MYDFFETLETGVECSIYADDIFISCSHQSLDTVRHKLENTLERINQWCKYSKLSLSPDKSTIAELSNKRIHSFPNILLAGTPLPWQYSIKYLGVYFSKRNRNTYIMQQMKNKALKKINALKGMAYKHYGPRAENLIQLINNSICSTFFYTCHIINKWSDPQLKPFNIIPTKALRIALGLPQWSPNIVLMKLAGQEIVSEKIRRLANKFFLSQISNQTFSPLYSNNPGSLNLKIMKEDKNNIDRIVYTLNADSNHIITIPRITSFSILPCKIYVNNFKFQDKNLPIQSIRGLFDETIKLDFQDFYIIATDASKNEYITSIAGVAENLSFAYRINHNNSIFTADALAICQAIDDLAVSNKNLLILSDSLSVLYGLQNYSIKSHSVIHRLASKIYIQSKYTNQLILLWTPGHSKILWNEQADYLARSVTESDVYIEWIASEDINKKYQERFKKANDDFFQANILKIWAIFQVLASSLSGPRLEEKKFYALESLAK
ncbi:putative RNA-directed DNA polymerase from transposon X-element [Trichonephila clavipes]|nr:putative RNA-directed DNA polymerase from transposon X-element [Trichonephila clavipes]